MGVGVGGVGGAGGGAGVGSTGAAIGAVAASSDTGSSEGLSGAAASITWDDTIDTGTEAIIGVTVSSRGQDTKASATTPACSAIDPRMAGPDLEDEGGRRTGLSFPAPYR